MSPKAATMSAFERRRLDNMAANRKIINEISTTTVKMAVPKPAPTKRVASSRIKREPVQKEPTRPTRQSSRLAGRDADSEVVKRKLEVEVEAENEKARQKKLRVNDDLALGDVKVEGRKWESGLDGMANLKSLGLPPRGAQPGMRTFGEEDIEDTKDSNLKEIRQRMNGLELYDKWAVNDIKIVPQRIYAMGFHPTEDKPIVFAGDKEGAIGVFDASQETVKVEDEDDEDESDAVEDPVIAAFKTHSRTITGFRFSPVDANAVFTSSYDSSIRKLDLDKEISTQLFAPTDPDEDLPISALDMAASDPNLILFTTLHGSLGRHDIRTEASKAEVWTLSDGGQKIGGFSLHPLHPHLVATASLDRTLKIWDLRNISGRGEMRHPALLGEHVSRLSVSHASWSSGGHIATSSYDDSVKIYDFHDAGAWSVGHDLTDEDMEPTYTVKHNNQTGRWVTILKPQFQASPRDNEHKFVIGNMNRFVDVYAANGEQLAQLGGDGLTAVPAVAHFHPSMDWVAGGTSSGKLALWM